MADISQIKLPNQQVYDIVDPTAVHNVDTEVSSVSTNPLENRAVHAAIAAAVEGIVLENPSIEFDTTAGWGSKLNKIGDINTIYVYTDYQQDEDGNNLAGLKVGDGQAYLIDLPFIDSIYYDHVRDTDIHITAEERVKWNNKVTCYHSLTDAETVVFTTN